MSDVGITGPAGGSRRSRDRRASRPPRGRGIARRLVRRPVLRASAQGSAAPLGRDVLRLQAFSDGVFAFAATLLVVSLEVPSSYEELLEALAGFPALAIAFAAIVSLWAIHREFFARYPLGDDVSMVINAALLFIVLMYVYPLKLLAELAAHTFLRVGTPTVSDMTPAQVQGVHVIFALAVLLTCLAIAALHLRAWQLQEELQLDARAQVDLVAAGRGYLGIGLVAGLAIAVAAVGLGRGWGLPIWMLLVLSPVAERFIRTHHQSHAGTASPGRAVGSQALPDSDR